MNRVAELTWPTAVGSGALLGVMVGLGLLWWKSRHWSAAKLLAATMAVTMLALLFGGLALYDRWLEAHGETTTREMSKRWLQSKLQTLRRDA